MDNRTRALMMGAAGSAEPLYIEDVFSTYLYTGNGSTQTITNGIDLAGKGGLVWLKHRASSVLGSAGHFWCDTVRGRDKFIGSDDTAGNDTASSTEGITSFGSSGFTLGTDISGKTNYSSGNTTYASWTFRKAAKFFDVVTWTQPVGYVDVPHSLGSVPGCIIVKNLSGAEDWYVYHRSLGVSNNLNLNTTGAGLGYGVLPSVTATTFNSGLSAPNTYVAYLFAHDAGGFGDAGTDSVVKCGSYTGTGAANPINLGWEPQWVLIKRTDAVDNWSMQDTMRGMDVTNSWRLKADTNTAESQWGATFCPPTATGFTPTANNGEINASGGTYIYIAIRRGPMKTPTDATKVFSAITVSTNDSTGGTTNFPVDLLWELPRADGYNRYAFTRLLGAGKYLTLSNNDLENTGGSLSLASNTSFTGPTLGITSNIVYDAFRRAPGFFDVVAYTGGVTNQAVNHNLGVTPEFIIVKARNVSGQDWNCYHSFLTANNFIRLNTNQDYSTSGSLAWNSTEPTSTQFYLGTNAWGGTNFSGTNYIAYLFATLSGVSKVGSYTGTGTTLSIDCGFTAGARFVLIKRTDSTGDWYVWDTARGIVSGNDPYILLNATTAEVTNTDYIDPLSTGFQISSTAPAAINANGGSFIYLAIA